MPRIVENLTGPALQLIWRDLRLLTRAFWHDSRHYFQIFASGWAYTHRDY